MGLDQDAPRRSCEAVRSHVWLKKKCVAPNPENEGNKPCQSVEALTNVCNFNTSPPPCPSRKRHDLSDVPAIVDDTYVLTVRGMRCDDCAATLQSALASVGGVMGVSVDLEGEACAVSAEVWVNPGPLLLCQSFFPVMWCWGRL